MSRVVERGGKWETWIQVQLYFLTGTPRAVLLYIHTLHECIVCVLLKNKFLYSCSIVFSWYCYRLFSLQNNLSTFKTQSQLSNQTLEILVSVLTCSSSFSVLFLSPFSVRPLPYIHPPPCPLSIHNPTTVRLAIVLKQITAARTIDAIVHVGRIQRRVLVAQYFHRLLPSNAPEEKTKRHQRLSAQ